MNESASILDLMEILRLRLKLHDALVRDDASAIKLLTAQINELEAA